MLVFLDLDGVLRREHSALWQLDPDLLWLFEATIRTLPGAEVVISSGWRECFPLAEIRGHFSPDIAARIIGEIPIAADRSQDHYRYREVLAFTRYRKHHGRAWVALDDTPAHYPVRDNIRILESAEGFDVPSAEWLLAMGRRYGAGRA